MPLKILHRPQPHLNTMAAMVFLRTGSAYETKAQNGISHFLEHLLFNGNAQYPDQFALDAAADDIGASMNALTSTRYTAFQIEAPAENCNKAVALLLSMFDNPRFGDFESERGVVLEEMVSYLNGRGDMYTDPAHYTDAMMYRGAMAREIIGTAASVKSITQAAIRRRFKHHYGQNNATLVVTGGGKYSGVPWSTWHSGDTLPLVSAAPRKPWLWFGGTDKSSVEIQVAFEIPGALSVFNAADALIAQVLCSGMNSRLPKALRSAGLAYHFNVNIDQGTHNSVVYINVTTSRCCAEVVSLVWGILDDLRANGPSDEELGAAHRAATWSLKAAHDCPMAQAMWLGTTVLGVDTRTLNDTAYIAALRKITKPIFKSLIPANRFLTVLGHTSAATRHKVMKVVSTEAE